MPSKKFTPKQTLFIAEYLVDLNGTQAAIRAKYSPKTANEQAARLLAKVSVKAEIERRLSSRIAKVDSSVERILSELSKVAFADPRKFFNEDGSLKKVTDLDGESAAALQGFDVEALYKHFAKGSAQEIGTVSKVKFADRLRALELLGRYRKMFTEKIEISGLDTLAEQIQKARQRQSV